MNNDDIREDFLEEWKDYYFADYCKETPLFKEILVKIISIIIIETTISDMLDSLHRIESFCSYLRSEACRIGIDKEDFDIILKQMSKKLKK